MYSAAIKGHLDIVKLLTEYNADVNASKVVLNVLHILSNSVSLDIHQWIALHWAAEEGHLDIVRLLIEHGANVNAKSESHAC